MNTDSARRHHRRLSLLSRCIQAVDAGTDRVVRLAPTLHAASSLKYSAWNPAQLLHIPHPSLPALKLQARITHTSPYLEIIVPYVRLHFQPLKTRQPSRALTRHRNRSSGSIQIQLGPRITQAWTWKRVGDDRGESGLLQCYAEGGDLWGFDDEFGAGCAVGVE